MLCLHRWVEIMLFMAMHFISIMVWCLILLTSKLKLSADSILFYRGQSLRRKRHVNKHILRFVKRTCMPIAI